MTTLTSKKGRAPKNAPLIQIPRAKMEWVKVSDTVNAKKKELKRQYETLMNRQAWLDQGFEYEPKTQKKIDSGAIGGSKGRPPESLKQLISRSKGMVKKTLAEVNKEYARMGVPLMTEKELEMDAENRATLVGAGKPPQAPWQTLRKSVTDGRMLERMKEVDRIVDAHVEKLREKNLSETEQERAAVVYSAITEARTSLTRQKAHIEEAVALAEAVGDEKYDSQALVGANMYFFKRLPEVKMCLAELAEQATVEDQISIDEAAEAQAAEAQAVEAQAAEAQAAEAKRQDVRKLVTEAAKEAAAQKAKSRVIEAKESQSPAPTAEQKLANQTMGGMDIFAKAGLLEKVEQQAPVQQVETAAQAPEESLAAIEIEEKPAMARAPALVPAATESAAVSPDLMSLIQENAQLRAELAIAERRYQQVKRQQLVLMQALNEFTVDEAKDVSSAATAQSA